MNVFNYEAFLEQYNKMKTIIGEGENDPSTIVGVINNSDSIIKSGLEYAENSAWASSKVDDWNELMPGLKTQLANLQVLLENAKVAAEAYNEFEAQNAGLN